MEPEQYDKILEKLVEDESIADEVGSLIEAACTGDAELARLLDDPATATSKPAPRKGRASAVPGVTLRSVEVRAFRGIGSMATLEFEPGPGLTLVIGRNGSGKSSFAEALEMLMTRSCRRWAGRPTVDWEHGWRNIHAKDRPLIRATFAVEGAQRVVAKRVWGDDAIESDSIEVARDGERVEGFTALGWDTGLAAYRPFLSYSELATLVEEPSRLYDQLESILGLEDVAAARKRLGDARKNRTREKKDTRDALKRLLTQLAASDDPRTETCREALSGRKWALDEVERILTGDADSEAVADVAALQRLTQIEPPPSTPLLEAAEDLGKAVAAESALEKESAERADQFARILEQALAMHEHTDGRCPVCEQALPDGWIAHAKDRSKEAARLAKAIRDARRQTQEATRALRSKIQRAPTDLARAPELGLGDETLRLWQTWEAVPTEGPTPLIAHVEEHALHLEEAVAKLKAAAATRRQELHDAWTPISRALGEWLPKGRRVVAGSELLARLKKAEDWLAGVEEDLRNDRFEPIAERAQQIWEMLRQESSVSLQRVELEKAGRRRKVKLNVTVDGKESVALAVMSQGELNALALSLFLPRMTLPDTPFRFLVIDDPVQAMDPLKVDGLARVLADVAATRQVIVFTHDTRLPEAVRRLQIPGRIVEVLRHPDSNVDVQPADDPIKRYLDDARALAMSEQELGPQLCDRILPSFCRSAIEAGCVAAVRRRRIGRGEAHESVASVLDAARTTNKLVALALFDDADHGGDVLSTLNNKLGRAATDAYQAVRGGAHGSWTGSPRDLIREAERLARCLEAER